MKRIKPIWIIVLIILALSISSEYSSMANQVGLREAVLSFIILTALGFGIAYWIKRSKKR